MNTFSYTRWRNGGEIRKHSWSLCPWINFCELKSAVEVYFICCWLTFAWIPTCLLKPCCKLLQTIDVIVGASVTSLVAPSVNTNNIRNRCLPFYCVSLQSWKRKLLTPFIIISSKVKLSPQPSIRAQNLWQRCILVKVTQCHDGSLLLSLLVKLMLL